MGSIIWVIEPQAFLADVLLLEFPPFVLQHDILRGLYLDPKIM